MEEVINFLRKASLKDVVAIVTIVAACLSGAFWVENRYAKISDTQERIEEQQRELEIQQTQLAVAQSAIRDIIFTMPEKVRNEVIERMKTGDIISGKKATKDNRMK